MSGDRERPGFFRSMPAWLRWTLILCLVYVLSPIDLRPDFFPGVGWIDDLLVVALTLYLFRTWHRGRNRRTAQRPRGPNVVPTTARVVEDDAKPSPAVGKKQENPGGGP